MVDVESKAWQLGLCRKQKDPQNGRVRRLFGGQPLLIQALVVVITMASTPLNVQGFATHVSLTDLQVRGNYQSFHASRAAPLWKSRSSSIESSSTSGTTCTTTTSTTSTPTTTRDVDVETCSDEMDSLLLSIQSPLEPASIKTTLTAAQQEENEFKKKIILFLLWCVACLSALDRVAMSVALLPISQEYGYTDAVKGAISSLFSVGYGVAILPAGIIVATASPRIVMGLGVALWSVSTIATPAAVGLAVDNMAPLLFVRACVGAGESVIFPAIQRLLQVWMQPEEKSLALAVIISGFQAGTITAYLLSPVVIDVLGGWPSLFYVYGGAGLLILLPWLFLAQDAPVVSTELVDTTSTPESEPKSLATSWDEAIEVFRDAPWKEFGRSKAVWGMLLTHCAKNWGLYNYLAWTPIFYSEQYGISVRDSAWLSVLPSVAGVAGGFVAGSIADSIIKNLKENDEQAITNVRKLFQGMSQYGPALAFAALAWHIPEDPKVAQAYLMAAIGLMAFGAAGNEVSIQEKAGERWVGLLYSVTSLPAVMVGTFGVYITGQLLDTTHQDWSYVFGLNAFVNVLGATAFVAWYDSKREFE
jgi:ACS family sodium-dependent inorganic phosphate cotransporter